MFGIFNKNESNEKIKKALNLCARKSLDTFNGLDRGLDEIIKGKDLSKKETTDFLIKYLTGMLTSMKSKRESLYNNLIAAIEEIYFIVQPVYIIQML